MAWIYHDESEEVYEVNTADERMAVVDHLRAGRKAPRGIGHAARLAIRRSAMARACLRPDALKRRVPTADGGVLMFAAASPSAMAELRRQVEEPFNARALAESERTGQPPRFLDALRAMKCEVVTDALLGLVTEEEAAVAVVETRKADKPAEKKKRKPARDEEPAASK
jgi:hypothetical protein